MQTQVCSELPIEVCIAEARAAAWRAICNSHFVWQQRRSTAPGLWRSSMLTRRPQMRPLSLRLQWMTPHELQAAAVVPMAAQPR